MKLLGGVLSWVLGFLLFIWAVAIFNSAWYAGIIAFLGVALIVPPIGKVIGARIGINGRFNQLVAGSALAIAAGPIVGGIVAGFTAPSERTEVAATEPKPDEIMAQLSAPPEPPRAKVAKAVNPERERRQKEAWLEVNAKDEVRKLLKDPDSAKFRISRVNTTVNVVCGEVNAKNGFGGYAGFEPFLSNGVNITVLASAMEAAEFNKVWNQMCS